MKLWTCNNCNADVSFQNLSPKRHDDMVMIKIFLLTGPGRPAHNAHPQTCSGIPIDPDELKQKEQDKLLKKRQKQAERKKIDPKKKDNDCDSSTEKEDLDSRHQSAFSIDSLLAAPKVPRGRRPNSKYPRVQACKSMNPLSMGMMPLFPVTQPVGFVVEQVELESEKDHDDDDELISIQGDSRSEAVDTIIDVESTPREESEQPTTFLPRCISPALMNGGEFHIHPASSHNRSPLLHLIQDKSEIRPCSAQNYVSKRDYNFPIENRPGPLSPQNFVKRDFDKSEYEVENRPTSPQNFVSKRDYTDYTESRDNPPLSPQNFVVKKDLREYSIDNSFSRPISPQNYTTKELNAHQYSIENASPQNFVMKKDSNEVKLL